MICPMKFNSTTLDDCGAYSEAAVQCPQVACAWWDPYAKACAVKSLGLLRRIEDLVSTLGDIRVQIDQLNRI